MSIRFVRNDANRAYVEAAIVLSTTQRRHRSHQRALRLYLDVAGRKWKHLTHSNRKHFVQTAFDLPPSTLSTRACDIIVTEAIDGSSAVEDHCVLGVWASVPFGL